jgi:hypothetical protein
MHDSAHQTSAPASQAQPCRGILPHPAGTVPPEPLIPAPCAARFNISTRAIPPETFFSFQLKLYVILVPGGPIQPNSAFQLKKFRI